MPGERAGLLKDMIQTVPDPAAHIQVGFPWARRRPGFLLSGIVVDTRPQIWSRWGQPAVSLGQCDPPPVLYGPWAKKTVVMFLNG